MATWSGYFLLTFLCGILQAVASPADYEPMVAFRCGFPAVHRGVNGWISDQSTVACWEDKHQVLGYCRQMYPNHNITNVVEASYEVDIAEWQKDNHVRPYRCIVDSFQSEALLVPQHCKFDHQHNDQQCREFSHWMDQASQACRADGMVCKSFGLLLPCDTGIGQFSGVEYVCCPGEEPVVVPPQPMDQDSADDDDNSDDNNNDEDDGAAWQSEDSDVAVDEADQDLYELYLRGEPMPATYVNEHQRFEAALRAMHKQQEAKNTQLMKDWTAARDHVHGMLRNDAKMASKESKEIAQRFQRLYSSYEEGDLAQKQQIVALHQQHVQSELNQHKRLAMQRYMRALERGDVMKINRNLRNYIKAEEKDVRHTVNHYGHVKSTDSQEAERIHDNVIQHLKLCQQRMEQALEMLERYPEIERQVRPQTEQFMKTFDDMADRIRTVVLPDPATSSLQTEEEDNDSNVQQAINNMANPQPPQASDEDEDDDDEVAMETNSDESPDDDVDEDEDDEEIREDEHDYERHMFRPAHQQHNAIQAQQDLKGVAAGTSAQVGTTVAIAMGSVAIFVVLVVAVVMMRRRSVAGGNTTQGYVEVDPAASPEERHVANMQMNGYENPTYRYFEVQTTK